jgi:thioredoxin 1
MTRKYVLAIVAGVVGIGAFGGYQGFLASNAAIAAETRHVDFTNAGFAAAQKAGKPILLDVWASWCPTCKAQQPGIAAAQNIPANKGLVVMRINYDTQKAEMKPLNITRQSTLIAFKGSRETGRLIAATDPAKIAALVATTR